MEELETIHLSGRILAKTEELHATDGQGNRILCLGAFLATEDESDEEHEIHADWYELLFFEEIATWAKSLIKVGDKIWIDGQIQCHEWPASKAGETRRQAQIDVDYFKFGPKGSMLYPEW